MSTIYSALLLPQNYIAESIIIGIIIINPHMLNMIIPQISIDYFFIESHKTIYRNLTRFEKNNNIHIDIDPVKLAYSLKRNNILTPLGGIKIITELIKQGQVFNSSSNINFYIKQVIKILQNNHKRRMIIQYGYNIIRLAYNYEFPNYLLDIKASQYLKYISSQTDSKNLDSSHEIIGYIIHNIKYKQNNNTYRIKKLYSGFKDLDRLTHGLPDGDLIVIAGRPSMGKTSLVMNITYNLIKYFNAKVCLFSLEMTKTQILQKLLCIGSGISIQNLIHNTINTQEWYAVQTICSELLIAEIYINDNPNISIDEIEYISKIIYQNDTDTKVIIIDYLQLISEKNSNIENRNHELSYITRKLKILAQSLLTPIIVLSQLNRSIEKRLNKQPLLSDLKESGCISYKTLIDNKINNIIHIKTLYTNIRNFIVSCFFNKKNRNTITNNQAYQTQAHILNQYIFKCKPVMISQIFITDNHLFLAYDQWIKQNHLEKKNIIIKSNNYKLEKMEKVYITTIVFSNYNLVYDITKYDYCNFICNEIILHNSIEQDADIVMMLYKDSITKDNLAQNQSNSRTVDIIISKNRNGPTGTLKLYFDATTAIFTNSNNFITLI